MNSVKEIVIIAIILLLLNLSYATMTKFTGRDGKTYDCYTFSGEKPLNYESRHHDMNPENTRDVVTIDTVPAYDWSYGCFPTAAAMYAGYYDQLPDYENIYTGPTNNGVAPPTNVVWGSEECPLAATKQGLDGLTSYGHVDDYWDYLGSNNDPYDGNWPEHVWADCLGDFMGSNQATWNVADGETSIYFGTDGLPLYNYTDCEFEDGKIDGCHGIRDFFASKGYDLGTNYTQYIEECGELFGYTFDQYKEEIDDENPVLLVLDGHIVVGYGYNTDSSDNIVYIRNTWDHSFDTMIWGGNYYGYQHIGVVVLNFDLFTPIPIFRIEPLYLYISKYSGFCEVNVYNDGGAGIMLWEATLEDNPDWIQITTGHSGQNDGIVTLQFEDLPEGTCRVAELNVTTTNLDENQSDTCVIIQNDYDGDVYYNENLPNQIQNAIDEANEVSSPMIYVHEGEYIDNIDFLGKNLKIIAVDGPELTSIQGASELPSGLPVVTFANGETDVAELRGFTIRSGTDNRADAEYGGGILISNNSYPTLENLIIENNNVNVHGGGIAIIDSHPELTNIVIRDNSAGRAGGGIYCENSAPSLTNITVTNNIVDGVNDCYGGGIYLLESDPEIKNTCISYNVVVGSNSNRDSWGGGIFMEYSNPLLENLTIYGNYAADTGGAVFCTNNSNPIIKNTIIYENDPDLITFDQNCSESSITVSYSNVQNGISSINTNNNGEVFWNIGNFDADPLFVDAGNNDFRLKWNIAELSPCIDAGDPSISDADDTPIDVGAIPNRTWHDFHATEFNNNRIRWVSFPTLDRYRVDAGMNTDYVFDPLTESMNFFFINFENDCSDWYRGLGWERYDITEIVTNVPPVVLYYHSTAKEDKCRKLLTL